MHEDREHFKQLIDRFPKARICVVGDVMVDRFIRGRCARISPEAPVPVVQVKEEVDLPGGAGNVIMNLQALGAQVTCCGVIGEDDVGDNLVRRFQDLGIRTDGIRKDPGRATALKTRVIAEHQQVVRFDRETVQHISPALQKQFQAWFSQALPKMNAVILSDYGKGMITRGVVNAVMAEAQRRNIPVCVDPKPENFSLYQRVTCMTPNFSEAKGSMHRARLDGPKEFEKLGKDILRALKTKSVLITQGEQGMTLFEKSRSTHIPTKAQEVFDVTGAGDTVISTLTLALACGASLLQAAQLSNLAASVVVAKLGTATVSPAELKEALKRL